MTAIISKDFVLFWKNGISFKKYRRNQQRATVTVKTFFAVFIGYFDIWCYFCRRKLKSTCHGQTIIG